MGKRKCKVLHIIYSLNAGGIETFVMNIFKNIDRTKVAFDFLVIKNPEEVQFYDETVRQLGGHIYPVASFDHNKIRKYINTRKGINTVLKENEYDVVHIHSGQVDKMPDVLIARLRHVPKVIFHSHNNGLTKSAKFYHMRRWVHVICRPLVSGKGNECFACSKAAGYWSFTKHCNNSGRVKVISNGIDVERFRFKQEQRDAMRKRLGVTSKFVVGHVGRFEYQKNHEFLIDIFSEIHKKEPNSVLLLVGTGSLQEQMKEKVQRLGIESSVMFYGTSTEIPLLLQAMDVFLFPSHFEGLPVIGIEVQASSLHAVASNQITSEIKMTDYWESYSLKDSPKIWSQAVLKYRNGYKRIDTSKQIQSAGYDIKTIARELEEIYMEKELV